MKILLLSAALDSGGVETGTIDLSNSLKALGEEVIVVSAGGSLVEALRQCGIKHIQLPIHSKSLITFLQIPKLVRIIREESIDIVHAQSRMPAWVSYFACRITGAAFITSCHGYYSRHLFSRVMGWGKRVIVISRIIDRHMSEKFGVPKEKIRLVYRGVDLSRYNYQVDKYQKAKDVYRIVNIARITPIKGQDDFIRAIGIVAKHRPNIEVLLVGGVDKGKGNYGKKLHGLVNKSGLQDKIKFLGARKDVADILKESDILVLSTRVPEAFGRVIIEAGAAGVAVCAPDIGGVGEIIDDRKDGVLFSCGDANSMAEAIMDLLNDKHLMQECSLNLRKKVENQFSLERMAKETLKVYKEAYQDKNILVVKLGGLGDLILATPSLKALRNKFPGARISLLTDKRFKGIIESCPYIDELILFDRKKKNLGVLVSELKKRNFGISIDFKNSGFTHFAAYFSGIPHRYGFSRVITGICLNHPERLSKNLSEEPVKQQYRILKRLGISSFEDELQLWPRKHDDEVIERVLNDKGVLKQDRVIGLAVGASPEWPTKNWPIENFSGLSRRLAQSGFKVVLLGTDYLKEKISAFPKDKNIVSFIGDTDLNQLVSLIKRLDILVTPDSAPMHIACAVKTKIIALFGPTDPERHIPPAEEIEVLVKHIDCQPCYKRKCVNKEKIACLVKISVEEVLDKIGRIMNYDVAL